MNSQYHDIWPLMKAGDPNVAEALDDVDIVTKEFGVGPSAGINTGQDYREFFEYVDALHERGIDITMTGDPNADNVPTMEYNLATYFLIDEGGDYINGHDQTPGDWWRGLNVNLGTPLRARERLTGGLWRRRFSGGVVYTVEPGAAAKTITLPTPMRSAEWGEVQSLTLAAKEGAVLVG